MTETAKMNSGYEIPSVGYGTWTTPSGEVAIEVVSQAIKAGYRHIDAAHVYGNEPDVGKGIAKGLQEAGVKREELFVTGKVWTADRGYVKTRAALFKSLNDLKLEYLDLYLIHWPMNAANGSDWEEVNASTWKAMEDLQKEGYIRTIGVSNFLPHHLEALAKRTDVMPAVNQIESHPGYYQKDLVAYCQEKGILVEAYSPLGHGNVIKHPLLVSLAEKYNKNAAQICIRWNLQHGIVPLPKSLNAGRMAENLKVFDFEISAEDMAKIDAMELCGFSGNDPDTFSEM